MTVWGFIVPHAEFSLPMNASRQGNVAVIKLKASSACVQAMISIRVKEGFDEVRKSRSFTNR